MSSHQDWTTDRLLREQSRLLVTLKNVTTELKSRSELEEAIEAITNYGTASRLLSEAANVTMLYDQPTTNTLRKANSSGSNRGKAGSKTTGAKRGRWQRQNQDLIDQDPEDRPEPPSRAGSEPQKSPSKGSPKIWGRERRAADAPPDPVTARGRSRDRKPITSTSTQRSHPSDVTIKKREEIIAKEFPEVNPYVISRSLTEAGWHVGQARMILTLARQFPERKSTEIVSALRRSRFDAGEARELLLKEHGDNIAEKPVPKQDMAGRGFQYPWAPNKRSPAESAGRLYGKFAIMGHVADEMGHNSSLADKSKAARQAILGEYSKASVRRKKGDCSGPAEVPEKEIVGDDGELQLTAGPHVSDLGFDEVSLPPDPVIVATVRNFSWAKRLGVVPGAELIAINGRDVLELSEARYLKALEKRPLQLNFLPPRKLEVLHQRDDGTFEAPTVNSYVMERESDALVVEREHHQFHSAAEHSSAPVIDSDATLKQIHAAPVQKPASVQPASGSTPSAQIQKSASVPSNTPRAVPSNTPRAAEQQSKQPSTPEKTPPASVASTPSAQKVAPSAQKAAPSAQKGESSPKKKGYRISFSVPSFGFGRKK